MKTDQVYLDHILAAVAKVESFATGLSREEFDLDKKSQSAVIMQLVLIGELVKRISDETKLKIDLPWKDIAGFRDRAIHDYYEIDLGVAWNTLADDLPVLKQKLVDYLAH